MFGLIAEVYDGSRRLRKENTDRAVGSFYANPNG